MADMHSDDVNAAFQKIPKTNLVLQVRIDMGGPPQKMCIIPTFMRFMVTASFSRRRIPRDSDRKVTWTFNSLKEADDKAARINAGLENDVREFYHSAVVEMRSGPRPETIAAQ